MGHRCGYIEIPKKDELFGKLGKKYELGFNYILTKKLNEETRVYTHDGITFERNDKCDEIGFDKYSLVIGWDYAHLGDDKDFESAEKYFTNTEYDYIIKNRKSFEGMGYSNGNSFQKDEVEKEAIAVIEQLVTIKNKLIKRYIFLTKRKIRRFKTR